MCTASRAGRVLFIIGIVTALAVPARSAAEEVGWSSYETALYAGVFDVANGGAPFEVGIEVRRTTSLERLAIVGGIAATEDHSAWVYGGARYDLATRSSWIIAPGFAIALYEQGDGKDLGQTLEFRSSIEVGGRVSERLRVGLVFYHLSNGSLSDVNPGSNSLVLSFGLRHRRR